jgi:hypothetical protein
MRRAEIAPETRPAGVANRHGGRGLRLAGLALVLLALAAPGIGCTAAAQKNQAAEADLAALPREVREALDRAAQVYPQPLNGCRWSEVSPLNRTNHPLYQVQGTNGRGNKVEIEVTSAGRILEVEEHGIPLGEVPSAVLEALKAKMPQFQPTRVEAIYQVEKAEPVSYGFEAEVGVDKKIEVYISADGKSFLN